MATTCDYCHKPLSLMRRLRGEQFCSVEHLDQFTAQQAELALERLAASVEEKPITARPAPLLKRLPVRQPEPLPEPPLPVIATLTPEADVQAAEFEVEHDPADAEAAFSRLSEALDEPPKPEAPASASPLPSKPVSEYPLAAFVAGVELSPRVPRKQSVPQSFAPAESWGRSWYPSALPQLRSQPTDLSELRTWSASKVSTKVPPLAPTREFLAGKLPASYAGPRASDIEAASLVREMQPNLPALDRQADEIKSEWAGADAQRMMSLFAGFRFPVLQGVPSAASSEMSMEDFQTTVRQPAHHWSPSGAVVLPQYANVLTSTRKALSRDPQLALLLEGSQTTVLQPQYRWRPSATIPVPEYAPALTDIRKATACDPALSLLLEGSQTPVLQPQFQWRQSSIVPVPVYVSALSSDRMVLPWAPQLRLPLEEPQTAALQPEFQRISTRVVIIPERAATRISARMPQSGSLVAETNSLEYILPRSHGADLGGVRPEFGWAPAIPVSGTWRSCPLNALATTWVWDVTSFDAELMPQSDLALPAPPAWTFREGFKAERVAMPVWQMAPVLAPARPMLSWTGDEVDGGAAQVSAGTAAIPGLPRTALVIGRVGPAFGWEQKPAHMGSGPDACTVNDAIAGETDVHIHALGAKITSVPPATSLIAPEGREALSGDPTAFLEKSEAVAPAESTPRYHDFRARVRTGLLAIPHRGYEEWSQPRLDVSMIETEPIAASRPALAEVHADMEQPYRFEAAHLGTPRTVSTPIGSSASEVPRAIPVENASSEFALSAWPKLPGATPTIPARNLISMGSTADSSAFTEKVQIAGPMRYSPVALVVVPPPQFVPLRSVPDVEDRFAAQEPLSSRAPRLRPTGFRMMGPFPKLPPCMPESIFALRSTEFAPALTDIPRQVIEQRQDVTGIPQFPPSGGYRLHPADYWAWPTIKAPKSSRVAADVAVETPVPTNGPVRRFGPGRVGLQSSRKTADGQPTGA